MWVADMVPPGHIPALPPGLPQMKDMMMQRLDSEDAQVTSRTSRAFTDKCFSFWYVALVWYIGILLGSGCWPALARPTWLTI